MRRSVTRPLHTRLLDVGSFLQTLSLIFKSGFSRIPVFAKDRNDVIGLLFTKDLIFIDPEDETPVKNFVQIFGRAVTVCILTTGHSQYSTVVCFRSIAF